MDNKAEYCVGLLYDTGQKSTLSVKGKMAWKTKKTARKHALDTICAIGKGGSFNGIVEVSVEDAWFEDFKPDIIWQAIE